MNSLGKLNKVDFEDNVFSSNQKIKENLDYFQQNFESISQDYFSDFCDHDEDFKIKEKANEIIQRYSIIEGVSYNHSVIGVCSLFQSGAYLKSVLNRIVVIKNIEFTKTNFCI